MFFKIVGSHHTLRILTLKTHFHLQIKLKHVQKSMNMPIYKIVSCTEIKFQKN